MRVYRYLSKNELNALLAGDFDKVGQVYNKNEMSRINSHKYKESVRYLHFFKNEDDIAYVRNAGFLPYGDYYVCTFDIPLFILLFGIGEGYYGYNGALKATEFIVPADLMKTKYLRDFKLDTSLKSPLQDMIENFRRNPFTFKSLKFREDFEDIKSDYQI